MSTYDDPSRTWQGHGGPEEWNAAWDRTRGLLAPSWPDPVRQSGHGPHSEPVTNPQFAAEAAALATALYLLARREGVTAAGVTREQVEGLLPGRGESRRAAIELLHRELAGFGHTLESTDDFFDVNGRAALLSRPEGHGPDVADPVAAWWPALSHISTAPRHRDDATLQRGPALFDRLFWLLSPLRPGTFKL